MRPAFSIPEQKRLRLGFFFLGLFGKATLENLARGWRPMWQRAMRIAYVTAWFSLPLAGGLEYFARPEYRLDGGFAQLLLDRNTQREGRYLLELTEKNPDCVFVGRTLMVRGAPDAVVVATAASHFDPHWDLDKEGEGLNPALAEAFAAFFARPDSFALGVCNGCQMMAALSPIIPGAQAWPKFTRNKSEQFEARFSLVEVLPSPSIFFDGMAGSRLPIAVAHGEGFADFSQRGDAATVQRAMRYVDHHGQATEAYPFNPNGSPDGLTSVTTPDGRFTVLMPHPERVFRNVLMSWSPGDIAARSPWMRMFANARKRLG